MTAGFGMILTISPKPTDFVPCNIGWHDVASLSDCSIHTYFWFQNIHLFIPTVLFKKNWFFTQFSFLNFFCIAQKICHTYLKFLTLSIFNFLNFRETVGLLPILTQKGTSPWNYASLSVFTTLFRSWVIVAHLLFLQLHHYALRSELDFYVMSNILL